MRTQVAERAPSAIVPRRATAWPASLASVVRREALDRRRALLVWGGSLGALSAFMAAIYPSIQSTIESVAKHYPTGLKQAFGVQAMSSVEGYVHAEMFSLIVPLAIGYLAVRGIVAVTVGAEDTGRLDTILSLPISRAVLMAGAYIVTAALVAGVMTITGVLLFAAGRAAGTHISAGLVAAGVMGVWPLALFFAGVAAVASGLLHNARAATGIAVGVLIGMYALDLAGRLANDLEPLRWVSAFRYYGAPLREGIDVPSFIGLTVAGVVLAAIGAWRFERRDILH
jgi:ABC-2 type transport system permease protein